MTQLSKLIESEIADFFAGFGHPGEPDIQSGEAQRVLSDRVSRLLAVEGQEPVYQFIYNNPYEEGYTEWVDCNEHYFNGVPDDCRRVLYAAPPVAQPVQVQDDLYKIANHLASAKGGLPDEWQDWAEEIETDIRRAAMLQPSSGSLQLPDGLPQMDYLDIIKFNADCAMENPDSIYANEFFLSLDEIFGEKGNYSLPVQAKAISVLIAEIFRIHGYKSAPQEPTKCWCHTCRPVTMTDMRFVVCPECGNKRCPQANYHRHACSGSNKPGQEGSAYPEKQEPTK